MTDSPQAKRRPPAVEQAEPVRMRATHRDSPFGDDYGQVSKAVHARGRGRVVHLLGIQAWRRPAADLRAGRAGARRRQLTQQASPADQFALHPSGDELAQRRADNVSYVHVTPDQPAVPRPHLFASMTRRVVELRQSLLARVNFFLPERVPKQVNDDNQGDENVSEGGNCKCTETHLDDNNSRASIG